MNVDTVKANFKIISILISVIAIPIVIFTFLNKVTSITCNKSSECFFNVYNLGHTFDMYIYSGLGIVLLIVFVFILIKHIIALFKSKTFTPIRSIVNQVSKLRLYHIHPKYWIKKIGISLILVLFIGISIGNIETYPYKYKFSLKGDNEKKLSVYCFYLFPLLNRKTDYILSDSCSFNIDIWYSSNADYKSEGSVSLLLRKRTRVDSNCVMVDKIMLFEGSPGVAEDVGKALNQLTDLHVNVTKID
jgi:hypothetical protein